MEINTKYAGLKMIILAGFIVLIAALFMVNAIDFPVPATVIVNPPFIISLDQGWNLISILLILENNSIESVFNDIMNKVIVIHSFDQGALTYTPEFPELSSLGEIDYLHGYWIKVNETVNLTVFGTIPENKTINLTKGWNLISYLCNESKNVEYVFADIMNKVIVINGFYPLEGGAKTYDPQLPEFSDLEKMKPKFGYWIKMNETTILDYNNIC